MPETPPIEKTDPTLSKAYTPAEHESAVWRRWEDSGVFHADPDRVLSGEAEPYCILIPPPNVTAALHLGHALNNTLQDVLVRAHRMKGFETLWMPGTDHAGIATQTVVDRRLRSEGKPALAEHKEMERRGEDGREKFVATVQAWKDEYEARITEQLRAMGCSCDWARQRFTMDEICARAVREAFFRLFRDGLIERGKRLVNWDPVTQTALSDDEVEMKEVEGKFYYLRYPLVHRAETGDHSPVTWGELFARGYPGADAHPEDDQAWVTVATTRPETYLGDVAVAVNPRDPRAESLRGLLVDLPLMDRVIPILEDDYVVLPVSLGGDENDAKAKFATGFLKVTPAHDPNDWELGLRHRETIERECSAKTHLINVMAPDASISKDHGWPDFEPHGGARVFIGLSREAAREKVVKEFQARTLNSQPLLESIKPHVHSVGHSYRSHAMVEPYLSDQWYCRVTDDRLRGHAQRALAPEQRTAASLEAWAESAPTPPLSGTGVPPVSSPSIPDHLVINHRNLPHWQLGGSTYFITFRIRQGELTPEERRLVLDACFHWHNSKAIVRLATVMPDHVHVLLTPERDGDGWHSLSQLLHSIKSYTAHEINKRRGTSGPVWQDESFDRIVRDEEEFREKWNYMLMNPVRKGLAAKPGDYAFTRRGEPGADSLARISAESGEFEERQAGRLSHREGEGSGDGSMTFFPARYAKTYETWQDNLRDWCISRQLWWGHRIPVWSIDLNSGWFQSQKLEQIDMWQEQRQVHTNGRTLVDSKGREDRYFVCVAPGNERIEEHLEAAGFERDPDVLDTWFSSALWPLSTLGWPEPGQSDQTRGLLEAFNPTSVLCTAREIITLWVSRMVMFNRYFLGRSALRADNSPDQPALRADNDPNAENRHTQEAQEVGSESRPTPGPAPFRHVFIHAMIQDGEGRKMSKSLGNGVDPLDIIHSHGADAMRFTLVEMTTQTQDVRMPVEPDPETGRNTSPKFDLGRNFCNKLWNAARFALSKLEPTGGPPLRAGDSEAHGSANRATQNAHGSANRATQNAHGSASRATIELADLTLADRWMLARLREGIAEIDQALATYQFSAYAKALYDLVRRDFCDWYLEAIKPTIAGNAAQQGVLRLVLDALLRLLHPVIPFITETIYEKLAPLTAPKLDGLTLDPPRKASVLASAGWPAVSATLADESAKARFERVRTIVDAIRQVRSLHQVEPRRRITLHADAVLAGELAGAEGLVEWLAGLGAVTTEAPAGPAVILTIDGVEHRLSDLADAVDASAERERLEKEKTDLEKSIKALEGRLGNPGYTDKAPPHLVQQTRDQHAKAKSDLEGVIRALESLG